jgi:uncharacterized coiled-coil protein SlyX
MDRPSGKQNYCGCNNQVLVCCFFEWYDRDMEDRLTKMEVKISYMEETITTLDSVVTEQAQELTALKARLSQIEKRMAEMVEEAHGGLPESERPPHY